MTEGSTHGHSGPVGPTVHDAEFWNQRYGSRDSLWSGQPNPQLVAEAAGMPPGRAADIGCGEGADAVWLARQGWQVTAVDISSTALARAADHADQAGSDVAGRIEWVCTDVTTWEQPSSLFDLVSAQFVHFPTEDRLQLLAQLGEAVAEGGTLLFVGHDLSDLDTTVPRPALPDYFATAEQLAMAMPEDEWEIEVAEARPRTTVDPEGRDVVVHDAVLRAKKRRQRPDLMTA